MSKSKIDIAVLEAMKKSIITREDLKREMPTLAYEAKMWAIYKTVEFLMQENVYKTYNDNEETLVYNNGIYLNNANSILKENIEDIWQKDGSTHTVVEIINHIKRKTFTKRDEFNNSKLIAVENGLIEVSTGNLIEFSPDKLYTYKLPIRYDANLKCPKISKFLTEVLKPDDVPVAYEIIGYCLWNGYPIHKAIMLHGGGANGKSTFINLLKAFIGTENSSSVSLQDLCDGDYSTGWLYGKLANLYADLEAKALKSTGRFKILTGEDSVTSNVKYGQPITFTNSAKMIFSANKIPATYDDTDAFYRRWVILHFARTFDDKEANKNLIKELTTPEELSGLLNESLKALRELLTRGHFATSKTTEELRLEYTKLSDPVGAFIIDCIEQSDDYEEMVEKDLIYNAYITYCKERRLNRSNEVWFWKDFRNRITCSFYRDRKQSKQYVKGICFDDTHLSLKPKKEDKNSNTEALTPPIDSSCQGIHSIQGKSFTKQSLKNEEFYTTLHRKNTLDTLDTLAEKGEKGELSEFKQKEGEVSSNNINPILKLKRDAQRTVATMLYEGKMDRQDINVTAMNKGIDMDILSEIYEEFNKIGLLSENGGMSFVLLKDKEHLKRFME